ncbi:hypothetical protein EV195_11211 [Tenacibaculum skagerrakense]|uniref:Uncharacterized protein n=1 Tax=Tenacibaculum skagerrakense TaxID=186571 RepID=A0A4R2NLP0_9FLAO|nr:hypothetical protein [Tenacibaculum skagerrakense]TCP22362.1 hypothetical protein EV195_11211 [Tenacibaculum skagerrakense]
MLFWKTKNRIEPKQEFYSKIKEYYIGIAENQIPLELLNEIILKVTDRIYSDYKRFWKQYPKSRKRYSTLKMADIENPFIHFMITDFFQEKNIAESWNFSKILFKKNEKEFNEHLEYKNWYETK